MSDQSYGPYGQQYGPGHEQYGPDQGQYEHQYEQQHGQYEQHAPYEQQGQYGQQGPYGQYESGPSYAAAPYGQPEQQQPYAQPAAPYAAPAAASAQPTAPASPRPSAPRPAPTAVPPQPPLTAAQRARAEGRSPIIEPGAVPAALTAVLALLLAGGAALGSYALLVPLVVLQAVTAAGWFRLNGMWPARQGIALAFLGALTADAALLATSRGHAPAVLLATPGIWLLLALVLQLRSRASADERLTGLMATIVSAALAIAAAGHLAAGQDAVVLGGSAVAAAILLRAVPAGPTAVSVLLALLAAAAAGYGAAGLTDYGARNAALLGLGAGVCALIGHRVASYDYPSRFVHMTAGVALPLTAVAPAVYVLGRALG